MRQARVSIALVTLVALGLGGCVSAERAPRAAAVAPPSPVNARYASLATEPFSVAAVDTSRIPERFLRREVDFQTVETPGTIVIDTSARHLYLVQGNGRAIRYGVGVGKEGMSWSGVATVGNKRAWPDWYPPKEMIARRPDIVDKLRPLQSGRGLPGGEDSPLGARALYLWQDGKDTLYRIHGTLEPYTMGQAVSSGCVRMINQDAIDLFSRVDVGTRVVVLPDAGRGSEMASADAVSPAPAPSYRGRPYAGYVAQPAYGERDLRDGAYGYEGSDDGPDYEPG